MRCDHEINYEKHLYSNGYNNRKEHKNTLTMDPVIIWVKYALIIKRSEYIDGPVKIKMILYLIHLSINRSI